MASKPTSRRAIPCPLGTCREDQWCPHAVQAALAADGNGAPAVRATPIVAGNDGDGEEWLAHPPGIALRRQTGEEELALRREVPLKEQDGAYISSQTGCEKYCHNVLETAVKKVAISTRVLGARWGTIPSCWSSLSVKKKGVSVPRLRGSRRSARGAPTTMGATSSGIDVL